MFQVVELTPEGERPVVDDAGQVMTFENGSKAADHARLLGGKHQPRPVKAEVDWRSREQARFDSGHYVKVPWVGENWFDGKYPDHFVHVSVENSGMVAYTESDEKGAADRQNQVRVGRYLERFFSKELTSADIARLSAEFSDLFEENLLLFAKTADEIEHVYITGPNSCMAHKAEDYNSPFHPVRVYAAGDLAVAYMTREGKITARSLCWPEKKIRSTIYGDSVRLTRLLQEAGFYHSNDGFTGAKIRKIAHGDGYVMPYIDAAEGVVDCGDHFEISFGSNVDYAADDTNGLTCPIGEYCEYYGENRNEESYYIRDRQENWCETALENYGFTCAMTDHHYSEDVAVYMANGETWSESAFNRFGGVCARTEENYHLEDLVEMANGDHWHIDQFAEHGFVCQGNGKNYPTDDQVILEDGRRWSSDHFQLHGESDPATGMFFEKKKDIA
ncbi:hypothetical protein IZ6_25500 [Terrihabitans soli]|uniref:Uncharacterized protein n=1 Tax=Terrihabitans soli TaxID=708113 RepID=A0A6S6QW56_9HYPH|nr:hypothetical protein [Terrihabitans soli]BCJ91815.1 hypothetical protein IZ6_25500 [Terrihabitans soli]